MDLVGGEGSQLQLHVIRCPTCGDEEAQRITFAHGQVVRCDACGLLELISQAQDDPPPPEHPGE